MRCLKRRLWQTLRIEGMKAINHRLLAHATRLNTQLSTPSDSSTETPGRLQELAERSRRARAQRSALGRRVDAIAGAWTKLTERLSTLRKGGPRAFALKSARISWISVFGFVLLQVLLVLAMLQYVCPCLCANTSSSSQLVTFTCSMAVPQRPF